jgi:hypothetical protein
MLIKATRLHPGAPQVYMVGMVVAEVVVEGMVEVESVVVVLKVAVVVNIAESVSVGMVVKATVAAITESVI